MWFIICLWIAFLILTDLWRDAACEPINQTDSRASVWSHTTEQITDSCLIMKRFTVSHKLQERHIHFSYPSINQSLTVTVIIWSWRNFPRRAEFTRFISIPPETISCARSRARGRPPAAGSLVNSQRGRSRTSPVNHDIYIPAEIQHPFINHRI